MDNLENAFIELGNMVERILKEISFGCEKVLKIHLEFIIKNFNKVKERCLTK